MPWWPFIVRRRTSHIFYSLLTDGGEVVSLMRLSSFTPRKIPDTQRLNQPQGHSAAGRIRSIEKNQMTSHPESNPRDTACKWMNCMILTSIPPSFK
jgi:hypothetical protein